MKTSMKAMLICSMSLQAMGAGVSVDTSCSQPGDLLTSATVSISPAFVGTGLQPVTATISGMLGQNVANSTVHILATVNDIPVLSLQQNLCSALQTSQVSSSSSTPAQAGLLGPVIQLLNPVLGTVNQLTSGLPIVGPLLGGLTGPLLGGLTGTPGTTGSQTGLLGTGGLLAPVNGVLSPVLNTVTSVTGGLPIVGPVVGGVVNGVVAPLTGSSTSTPGQQQGGLLGGNLLGGLLSPSTGTTTQQGGLLGGGLLGGVLSPVTGLLSPVLGTVNQLTSGLPIVGPLLGGLLGPLTGSATTQSTLLAPGSGGLLAPVNGLLAPVNGLLAPVTGLLNPVLGTVNQLTSGLPIVGPLLGGVLTPLTGSTGTTTPSTGGLVNGVVSPLLNTVTQVTSGLPIVGPILGGVLTPVTQLLVDVLNSVIGLLQGLPVVGGILTSVTQVVAPGTSASQGCPLKVGPVTLKFNLNLPIPALPSQPGMPNINVLVGLFADGAVPKQLVCAKVKVQL